MRICITSDLHGILPVIPQCDLFLLVGDICPTADHDPFYQANWLNTVFKDWINSVQAEKKVMVWGNHDIVAERHPDLIEPFDCDILNCSSTEYKGIKIWGTPFSLPYGRSWAFMHDEKHLEMAYESIPSDTDIILNHGPPFGHGDFTNNDKKHSGSKSLLAAIDRVNPSLVFYGHIHEGYGHIVRSDIRLINCSRMNYNYEPVNPIVELYIA